MLASPEADLHLRVRFRLDEFRAGDAVDLIRVRDDAGWVIATVYVGGGGHLALNASVSDTRLTGGPAVSTGTWHEVQIRVNQTEGSVAIWYDGHTVDELSGPVDLGAAPAGAVQIGDDGNDLLFDVRFDDVGIARERLPLLGTYATPTAVSAEPTATLEPSVTPAEAMPVATTVASETPPGPPEGTDATEVPPTPTAVPTEVPPTPTAVPTEVPPTPTAVPTEEAPETDP